MRTQGIIALATTAQGLRFEVTTVEGGKTGLNVHLLNMPHRPLAEEAVHSLNLIFQLLYVYI